MFKMGFNKQCLFLSLMPIYLAAMDDSNGNQFERRTNALTEKREERRRVEGVAVAAPPLARHVQQPVSQYCHQPIDDNEQCASEQCALITVNQGLLKFQRAYSQSLRSDNVQANAILKNLQEYCRAKNIARMHTIPGVVVPSISEFYTLCSQVAQWPDSLACSEKRRVLWDNIVQSGAIRLKLLAHLASLQPETVENLAKLLLGLQASLNELKEFNNLIAGISNFSALQGKNKIMANASKAIRATCAEVLCDLLLNVTVDPELSAMYDTLMRSIKPWADALTDLIRILKICDKPVSENMSKSCEEYIRKAKLLASQIYIHLEEMSGYISTLINEIRRLRPASTAGAACKIWIRSDYPFSGEEVDGYKSIINTLINSLDWVEKRLVRTQPSIQSNAEKRKDDWVEPPMDLRGITPELIEIVLSAQGNNINSLDQNKIKSRERMKILLHGKPGVGKTTIAEVFAKKFQLADKENGQECRPAYYLNIAYCKDSWANPVQHRFNPTLEQLRNKNGVLILDEIDAICDDKDTQSIGKAMNDLDRPEYANVSVIFIANNIDKLPEVLKSRTKPIIEVVKPDLQKRARLLNHFLHLWMQKIELTCLDDNFVDELARATDDFSIRDIENLLTLAQQANFARTHVAESRISREDFIKAANEIRPGLTMSDIWKGTKNVLAMLDECTRNPLVAQSILMGIDYLRRPQQVQPGLWAQYNGTSRVLTAGQEVTTHLLENALDDPARTKEVIVKTISGVKWICRAAWMFL